MLGQMLQFGSVQTEACHVQTCLELFAHKGRVKLQWLNMNTIKNTNNTDNCMKVEKGIDQTLATTNASERTTYALKDRMQFPSEKF
jgi:hypothetical protein